MLDPAGLGSADIASDHHGCAFGHVEYVLIHKLRRGDVVIMDNLSSHKRARTRELIEGVGAELVFLPPYSPDLNPIEMVFAKIKQQLRSLACRTKGMLWRSMQSVLDTITEKDSRHCFKNCGYIATPETKML